jgi:hypothetical protein
VACCAVVPVITQPPNSPDLVPSDCWLFPALRIRLKGTRLATMEDIKWNETAELASAGAANNGRIDETSLCVCLCVQESCGEDD